MRLGSCEHIGWERPRTVRVRAVLAGPRGPGGFAWLHVPDGAKGGPLDVVVGQRGPVGGWRPPSPGHRIEVASWTLGPRDVELLERAVTDDPDLPWHPPRENPDQWLFVES